MRDLTNQLALWLESGGRSVGEVAITAVAHGFEICHRADLGRRDLRAESGADAARAIQSE